MRRSIVGFSLVLAVLAVPLRASADPAPTEFAPAPAEIHHEPLMAGIAISAATILRSGSDPVQWHPVHLQASPLGQDAFVTVGTGQTDAYGKVSVESPELNANTAFRWVFDGDGTYAAAVSQPWTELVEPVVQARVSDRTPHLGQRVVVRGRMTPARPGKRVSVWTGRRNCWCDMAIAIPAPKRLAAARIHPDGTYRLVIRFATTGRKLIHVHVARSEGLTFADSYNRHLRVR